MTEENKQPTAATTAPEQQTEGELTISDLNAMKMIIDVASQRGAFKPGEMVVIGQTYNKLVSFLDNVAKQQQPAQPAQGA
jgi:hypothetical protein